MARPRSKRTVLRDCYIDGIQYCCNCWLPNSKRYFYTDPRQSAFVNGYCRYCYKGIARQFLDETKKDNLKTSKRNKYHIRRALAILLLGGKCDCKGCGEDQYQFLNIHHVNNDGAIDRERQPESQMHSVIIQGKAPDNYYSVKCYNCNNALQFAGFCHGKLST